MKISDQGFTERLSSQPTRTNSVNGGTYGSSASGLRQTSSDNLQLSNLASRLQDTSASDGQRAARLSSIAKAVNSNSFQISPAHISSALVSEAVQSGAR